MSGLKEFINNDELSSIIMQSVPEEYKNTGEWEFNINYSDKIIDTLELWKTKHRFNKHKIVINLDTIFTEFQMKQFFLTVIIKFDSKFFENNNDDVNDAVIINAIIDS